MKAPWNLGRYLPLAQRFLVRGRLPSLLIAVARKSGRQGLRLDAMKEDLRLLQGLCLAWWRGEYRAINPKALLAIVAALLYFLSPVDAIPDWLPVMGFVDDIGVLAWLMSTWRAELDAFRAWRAGRTPAQQVALEHLPVLEVLQREQREP
ncbi:MAG TPA: YkvA family protein [Pseudomonas sp.]|nr:YkvA family protein [Pseudomonas sp.]